MARKRSKNRSRGASQNGGGGNRSPTITVNRRARFDYDILDSVEAGIALTGHGDKVHPRASRDAERLIRPPARWRNVAAQPAHRRVQPSRAQQP